MNGREWTPDEKLRARKLSRTMTAPAIAKELGRTEAAVRAMLRKMGVDMRKRGEAHQRAKYPDSRVRELRELHGTGKWSPRELGKRFGMPLGTVQAIVYRQVRL